MIETIEFGGVEYPLFQAKGFASKFAFPFALEVCKGIGYDIGCNRDEWKLPGAIGIDPILNEKYNAHKLPEGVKVDYIFSSHCLEHLDNWVDAVEYWASKLRDGGVLFLYLPDYSQIYWRPWNNRKHKNIFNQQMLVDFLKDKLLFKKVFASGVDLNNSFMIIGEK
jgi:SAM-dependent methyltransferase